MIAPPLHTVLVVGAGSVGRRRAAAAASHPRSRLIGVCDADERRARTTADRHGCVPSTSWRQALDELAPTVVVVCTPPAEHLPVATAALERGAAVLVEKPFGRDLGEARHLAAAAARHGRLLKAGFNHRFHPAIRRAHDLARGGELGELAFVRCCYGHGGRPGYENEWRAHAQQAGGGELIDQGIHVVDLLCCLLGRPRRVHAEVGSLVWPMEVEDNAFGLLRFPGEVIASFHASWSQWKNRFEWQIYGREGAVEVTGLGGSYGAPALVHHRRADGPPESRKQTYADHDVSWEVEWDDWIEALDGKHEPAGAAAEAVQVMEVVDALYRAARSGQAVDL